MMTGVDLVHVPYRGAAPAVADLLAGQVQVYFSNMASSIEHIRAGKLRPLAVTTATRSDALPDVPTMGEFVPGHEASSWAGVGAPKATPAEIVDKLNKEINAGLADPKIKARLADLGGTPHSALMLAARITLAHFSVSSAMNFPKSAGEPTSGRRHILGRTRSVAAWSRAWRDRAAMSPGCRPSTPIFPASDWHSCVRLSLGSVGWR